MILNMLYNSCLNRTSKEGEHGPLLQIEFLKGDAAETFVAMEALKDIMSTDSSSLKTLVRKLTFWLFRFV